MLATMAEFAPALPADPANLINSDTRQVLDRVIAVMNGKGGVGKTSIVANVGGRLALGGLRVLIWNLDVSDDLGLDLGYAQRGLSDNGKGVFEAVMEDKPLSILAGVRSNLDVIPGGSYLRALIKMEPPSGRAIQDILVDKLAEVAPTYDIILLDTPPGIQELQEIALHLTRYVMITTKTDQAGWQGLQQIGPRFNKARRENPLLRYLGLVIFANGTSAKAVLKDARETLSTEFGNVIPLFDTTIRNSETSASHQRKRGQLAHEIARDAVTAKRERLQWLRTTRHKGKHRAEQGREALAPPPALSGSADSLAADYNQLSREVLNRVRTYEEVA